MMMIKIKVKLTAKKNGGDHCYLGEKVSITKGR
jgi:hypothetical protein